MGEDYYLIRGKRPLCGTVSVSGAKNAALPLLSAALLTEEDSVLENVPDISDVRLALSLLEQLGIVSKFEKGTVTLSGTHVLKPELLGKDTAGMRASILFLGPLLARCRQACLSLPGGCAIGSRPIDLHLMAMEALGAETTLTDGAFLCQSKARLHGAEVRLPFPSVGATENLLMAAVTAKGETYIKNGAKEPEIVDLANALTSMGANIEGAGTEFIRIRGVNRLHGLRYRVMADRIEAGTFLTASAITGGTVFVRGAAASHLAFPLQLLKEAGCHIQVFPEGIFLQAPKKLLPLAEVKTGPYPLFPTDLQPQFMALLTLAEGTSMMEETVFNARFHHAGELCRMGANIGISGQKAYIRGRACLHGACLSAADLRGGAALVLAALAAEGESRLRGTAYIARGYENFAEKLRALGGEIYNCHGQEEPYA